MMISTRGPALSHGLVGSHGPLTAPILGKVIAAILGTVIADNSGLEPPHVQIKHTDIRQGGK